MSEQSVPQRHSFFMNDIGRFELGEFAPEPRGFFRLLASGEVTAATLSMENAGTFNEGLNVREELKIRRTRLRQLLPLTRLGFGIKQQATHTTMFEAHHQRA